MNPSSSDGSTEATPPNGSASQKSPKRRLILLFEIALPWLAAVLLACCPPISVGPDATWQGFWRPLVDGAGLVGGDTYNYFLPLKLHYAGGLANNAIHLWHEDIGNGVPVVGESQTGVFYPINLVVYRALPLNAAYNASLLIHYVLAFVFTYWLAREISLTRSASMLSALVFTYGWFGPRACLEWAIVTGCWLPLAVLCMLRWLTSGKGRWLLSLAAVLAVQLLAGHFQLAFVTILTLLALASAPWVGIRVGMVRRAGVVLAVGLAFAAAAFQIIPTWQLKKTSQRQQDAFAGSVEYGHIPAWYLLQWIAPFAVYPDAGRLLSDAGAHTNKIEAHLYFGMLPLLLAAGMLAGGRLPRRHWIWLALFLLGLLLALGWPMPYLSRLPGFGYFRYPGRYSLMSQLGMALLAGVAASQIFPRMPRLRAATVAGVFLATVVDFQWVQKQDWYLTLASPPPIDSLGESEVLRILQGDPTSRILAPDGNTLALSGRACAPPYLGMGPAAYYKIWEEEMPAGFFQGQAAATLEVVALLRRMGVTHLLTERPLGDDWPVTPLWQGRDAFLGRKGYAQLFLYRFDASWGRAYLLEAAGNTKSVDVVRLEPDVVELRCQSDAACKLVLTDLLYPGWVAEVDGEPVQPQPDPLFRVLDLGPGEHHVVWRYRPMDFYVGLLIAGVTVLSLAAAAVVWRRRL